MYIIATILTSFWVCASMMGLSFQLFRFSVGKHIGAITLFSMITAHYSYWFNYILLWNAYLPMVVLFTLAYFTHFVLKVTKKHAFFMTLISMLIYISMFGCMTVVFHFMDNVGIDDVIFGEQYDFSLRIVSGLLCFVIVILLKVFRIGFTMVTTYESISLKRWKGKRISIAIFLSFLLLSIAYSLVVMKISNFQWILMGMMIAVAVLLYDLYKKEMDES
jgi:hypothetical protein